MRPVLFVPCLSSEPPDLKFKMSQPPCLPVVQPSEAVSAPSSRSGCPGLVISSTYFAQDSGDHLSNHMILFFIYSRAVGWLGVG